MAGTNELKQANGGRSWSADGNGIEHLDAKYFISLADTNLSTTGEFSTFSGLPAVGTAHPSFLNLRVNGYDFEELSGKDKRVIKANVRYRRTEGQIQTDAGGGSQQGYACVQWGWDASVEDREMTSSATGEKVINSAGDPFDAVPRYSSPAPVFTKVMRFKERESAAMSYNCKTNHAAMTIGSWSCPARTLLCTVSERRIFDDPLYNYEYTVQLKFKTNIVTLQGSASATEIGWDVAVTDAGMRELNEDGDKLVLIRIMDEETGRMCTVSSPALLNGGGKKISTIGGGVVPYNFRFQAYVTATFPAWFYSEPEIPA